MIVAEIGCGEVPGPYVEGATEHHAIDIDAESLGRIHDRYGFILHHADGARLDMFEDQSVDLALYRNVFGDPFAGFRPDQKDMFTALQFAALKDRDSEEYIEYSKVQHQLGLSVRTALLDEAMRILKPTGRVVIVEEHTPDVADNYLRQLFRPAIPCLGKVALFKAPLQDVLPGKYARFYPTADTWLIETAS